MRLKQRKRQRNFVHLEIPIQDIVNKSLLTKRNVAYKVVISISSSLSPAVEAIYIQRPAASSSIKHQATRRINNGGKGRRDCEERAGGRRKNGGVSAERIRSASRASSSGRRYRSGVRESHRVHVDCAEEEGGAPVQDDQQAGELRRRDHRVCVEEEDKEAEGGEGEGADAMASCE